MQFNSVLLIIVFVFFIVGTISYVLGSINTSIIVTKYFTKKDIRKLGSGNAGFTNVQPGNYFSETTGTKVYSSDGSGAALTELFNDAESVKGMIDQVETDVPLSDGQIVVVISSSDDVLSK